LFPCGRRFFGGAILTVSAERYGQQDYAQRSGVPREWLVIDHERKDASHNSIV
jgi:hypothetical protein